MHLYYTFTLLFCCCDIFVSIQCPSTFSIHKRWNKVSRRSQYFLFQLNQPKRIKRMILQHVYMRSYNTVTSNILYTLQGHFLQLTITAICVACLAHPVFSSRPRDGCHRRRIIHTVRYANCQQRRMFSYACRGFCSSSVHVSRFVDNRVDSQCQCCRADQTVTRRMRLICPTVSGNRPFRILYIPVSIPRSCRCRPCSALPAEIIPSERNLLQHRQIYWRILIRFQFHYKHFWRGESLHMFIDLSN